MRGGDEDEFDGMGQLMLSKPPVGWLEEIGGEFTTEEKTDL